MEPAFLVIKKIIGGDRAGYYKGLAKHIHSTFCVR